MAVEVVEVPRQMPPHSPSPFDVCLAGRPLLRPGTPGWQWLDCKMAVEVLEAVKAVKAVETVENRLGCLPRWQLTAHSWAGEDPEEDSSLSLLPLG